MARKGNPISVRLDLNRSSVRISAFVLLLTIFMVCSFLFGFDFWVKLQDLLLVRSLRFLVFRLLGWEGPLIILITGLLSAAAGEDSYHMMMAPEGGSGAGSSGTSSSNPGNPVVPPIDQGVHGEVKQDTIWDAVEAEERRKEEELRNSKEWKESERHLLKVENLKKSIGQRAKEIAQERGLTPGRCEAVEDAAKYIAEDVEEIHEKKQLHFLVNLMRDLNNPNSEPWERIEEEVKRWRSWED